MQNSDGLTILGIHYINAHFISIVLRAWSVSSFYDDEPKTQNKLFYD